MVAEAAVQDVEDVVVVVVAVPGEAEAAGPMLLGLWPGGGIASRRRRSTLPTLPPRRALITWYALPLTPLCLLLCVLTSRPSPVPPVCCLCRSLQRTDSKWGEQGWKGASNNARKVCHHTRHGIIVNGSMLEIECPCEQHPLLNWKQLGYSQPGARCSVPVGGFLPREARVPPTDTMGVQPMLDTIAALMSGAAY